MIRIKAEGLLPILQDLVPRLFAVTEGDFVQLVDGIEVQFRQEMEILISKSPDGRAMVQFPNGESVRIDRRLFEIIPMRSTETVTSLTLDEQGIDVAGPMFPGIRLEAMP